MAGATYLCGGKPGGPCPVCGVETEKDYTGARNCMVEDGGCGWSDYDGEPSGWGPDDA